MYLVLKLVHLIGVVMFLGNISIGIFWKTAADRTKNAAVMAYAMQSIIQADRIFTIPGIIILLIGGIATASVGNYPILGTGWILWALILFILSGLAFAPVSRVQRQLLAAAQNAQLMQYDQLSRTWNLWGTIALIAPLIAFAIMILKPSLPAFHA